LDVLFELKSLRFSNFAGEFPLQQRGSGGAAAADTGVGVPIFVEELGELFQHHPAQLLGVDDRHRAVAVAGHVMANADCRQLDLAEALDVLDDLAEHQPEAAPGAPPGGVGRLVDDVSEIVEAARIGRLASGDPALARLPALPVAGREAEDFDLDATALQGAGQNIAARRGWPWPSLAGPAGRLMRRLGISQRQQPAAFFQQEPGILARALASVHRQQIPSGWVIDVIVVDDGSPSAVERETANLTFDGPLKLRLIKQDNAGVAAARNRGLDAAHPDTDLIAFLDSDDIWPPTHLMRAIRAMTAGYDFCFTDSRRIGHYDSYLRVVANDTGRRIAEAKQKDSFSVMAADEFIGLMSKEFPAQISTVVYKRRLAPNLRFNTQFKAAAEDLLFLCMLVARTNSVVFDQLNYVEQGFGLNIFYNNLSWDSPKWLQILVDSFVVQRLIGKKIKLSPESKSKNDAKIKFNRRLLALHTVRSTAKYPSRVARAMADLIGKDPLAAISLPPAILFYGTTYAAAKFAEFGSASWRSKTGGGEPPRPRGH
jgi:succinoglycan biosynthesis protein ExoW